MTASNLEISVQEGKQDESRTVYAFCIKSRAEAANIAQITLLYDPRPTEISLSLSFCSVILKHHIK